MSIIEDISASAKAKAIAWTVLQTAEQAHAAALKSYRESMDFIWGADVDTAAVLKELGVDAKGLFSLLDSTAELLEVGAVGVTADKATLILEHTINVDGTIELKNPKVLVPVIEADPI